MLIDVIVPSLALINVYFLLIVGRSNLFMFVFVYCFWLDADFYYARSLSIDRGFSLSDFHLV